MIPQYKGVVLVRDAQGKPKVDDPGNMPPAMVMMLTEAEKTELGVYTGPLGRDAVRTVRLKTHPEGGFEAVDKIVALREIFDTDGSYYQASPRPHGPPGTRILNIKEA